MRPIVSALVGPSLSFVQIYICPAGAKSGSASNKQDQLCKSLHSSKELGLDASKVAIMIMMMMMIEAMAIALRLALALVKRTLGSFRSAVVCFLRLANCNWLVHT